MARHYRLVFRGKYLPGFVPDDVHNSVATLLNAPVDKVQALLSGIPAVIKQDVEVEQGNRYLEALAEIGLMTHLELLTAIKVGLLSRARVHASTGYTYRQARTAAP